MADLIRFESDAAARQAVSDSLRIDPTPAFVEQSQFPVGLTSETIESAKKRIAEVLQRVIDAG